MALPQIDVARARAFVVAHGNAVDAARLEGILGRHQPDRAVVRALEGLQNPDGGFPASVLTWGGGEEPGAGESSVAATCTVLAWLRDIPPLAGSPMAGRAVSFLRRSQQVDGSWLEADRPGIPSAEAHPAAQARLTALAAYTLQVMEPDHPDPIARGVKWLRAALAGGPDRACSRTLILAAALRGLPPDGALALLKGRTLSAGDLALWLTTYAELELPAHRLPLAVELLERLAGMQQPDGGWPAVEGGSPGGEAGGSAGGDRRAEATLGALRAFRGFGLILPA